MATIQFNRICEIRISTMMNSLTFLALFSLLSYGTCFLTQEKGAEELITELTSKLNSLKERVGKIEDMPSCDACSCNKMASCQDGWTKYNSSCYFFGVIPEKWKDAEVTCERLGGHLAVIETADEDAFIGKFIHKSRNETVDLSHGYTWVGGYDFLVEGKWLWITGKKFTYTNWRGSNPNNGAGSGEDCLDWSDGWNDHDCNFAANFVCERRLT